MKKMMKLFLMGLFLIVLLIVAFYQGLIVREYEVSSEKIEAPIRMVVVSDLHSTLHGEGQKNLLIMIEEQAPDLILLAGDIVDDKEPEEPAKLFLEKVAKIAPTYYVMGNHEIWSRKADEIRMMAKDFGVNVLENEMRLIEVKGQLIALFGIDDPESLKYEDVEYESWDKILWSMWEKHKEGTFSILLSHRFEKVDEYNLFDYDLIVAGHSHGGQVRIPFVLNGLLTPNQGLFPDYAGGEYKLNGTTTMIVSRGLVVNAIPRIFNPPEVVVIDFIG